MNKSIDEQLFIKLHQLPHLMRTRMFGEDTKGCFHPGHNKGVMPVPFPPKQPGGPGRRPLLSRERVLMILLNHEEGIHQKEIAKRMHINPSSMSEFIDRLEEDGYIIRRTDPADKRATLITLTEKGQARAYEIEDEHKERLQNIFGFLTEEEKEELLRLLNKLTAGGPMKEV